MPPRLFIRMNLNWAWGVLLLLPSCKAADSAAVAPAVTQSPTPTPAWERPGWTLVWQDEFGGGTIDPANWSFKTGGGWGNNEWEFYTDHPENARIEEGMLILEARAEGYLGRS
jgi:hypothetical protein